MPVLRYVEGDVAAINKSIQEYLGAFDPGYHPTLISVQVSGRGAYLLWSK